MLMHEGDTYSESVIFRQEDVGDFARITGDYNPVHFSDEEKTGGSFDRAVVHGMLAASAFGKVLGMVFPGKGSVVLYREITFIRPVFVGQLYTMNFKIAEIDHASTEGVIKASLKNEKGQICIKILSRIRNASAFPFRQ
jgi:3-hydroxybutyryl-CoA dehydratase